MPSARASREPGVDVDLVHARRARPFAVVHDGLRPLRGDVLHERAAEGDVEDLDAAADRERGQRTSAGRLRRARSRTRRGRRARLAELRVRRAAVARGIHVLAAGEDEARHAVEGRVGVGRVEDGQHERQQPRAADGRGVGGVHPDAERTADDLGGRR